MEQSDIIKAITEYKIIAIMRGVEESKFISLTEALYKGGIRLAEVTVNQSGSIDDTCRAISSLNEAFAGRVLVGAGTVMSVEQLDAVVDAGAEFIISPNTSRAVIERTKKLGAVSIPGALTPSEIAAAYEFGADFVKLFPADSLGLPYIKAVMAPITHIPLLAVGGVTAENIRDFLDTGVKGVGVGSAIVNTKLLKAGDYGSIETLAKRFTEAIK